MREKLTFSFLVALTFDLQTSNLFPSYFYPALCFYKTRSFYSFPISRKSETRDERRTDGVSLHLTRGPWKGRISKENRATWVERGDRAVVRIRATLVTPSRAPSDVVNWFVRASRRAPCRSPVPPPPGEYDKDLSSLNARLRSCPCTQPRGNMEIYRKSSRNSTAILFTESQKKCPLSATFPRLFL